MPSFHLDVRPDGLASLTFDVPDKSANVFDRVVLGELERLLEELARRGDIGCLVLLSGKPRTFIAGADLNEIAAVRDPLEVEAGARLGQRLFSAWAALSFPTVAAVRGICVGGGTELALASTHILLSDRADVRIGLPEIRLGILPAWGGCTRLPRRIGIAAALDLILTGRTVSGRTALKLGLADALLPDAAFLHLVRDFATLRMGRRERTYPRPDLKDLLLERNPIGRAVLFEGARKRTLAKTRGHYPAPPRAIEVVRVGVEEGEAAGLEAEARAVSELALSSVAKNLVHVFRLMEGGRRRGEAARGRAVGQAAVLGAGVMGGGIAQLVAEKAGVPLRLKDVGVEPLARGMAHAAALFDKQVSRRGLTPAEARRRMGLIRPTLDYRGFGRASLVVEAVVEKLPVKQAVFAEVAAATPRTAILASNTSSLSIDRIAEHTPGAERVVGMHFFNPVERMPLVEVVRGARSGDEAVETVVAFAHRLGKTPVVVKDAPGFLVNRLLVFYNAEAMWLLEEGLRIEDIDRAMTRWGMPMGPFALNDEVGLDVASKVAGILVEAFPRRLRVPDWIHSLGEGDRLGAKTGRGFYRYEGGRRTDPDPEVYAVLGLHPPRSSSSDAGALSERLVLPMLNEAARCLEEGIVDGPGDLDLAMILGTGFPPFRGGPCRWADQYGLGQVIDDLERLASVVGERFRPSRALREAAAAGGFYRQADTPAGSAASPG